VQPAFVLAVYAALNMDFVVRPRPIAVLDVFLVVREHLDYAQVPHVLVACAVHNMAIVEPPQPFAELGAKLDALAAVAVAVAVVLMVVTLTLLLLPIIALSLTPVLLVHVSLDHVAHIPQ